VKQLISVRRETFIPVHNVTLNKYLFILFSLLSQAGKSINEKAETSLHHYQTAVPALFILLAPQFEGSFAYRLNTASLCLS
jgi:hypothetical protein